MKKPLHLLITGEIGVGKSFLVQRLLKHYNSPINGFISKWMVSDEKGKSGVYIFPAATENYLCTPQNCIATREAPGINIVHPNVFENYGVELLSKQNIQNKHLILMDELGFMESDAPLFCKTVLDALDGDIPVLAVVKMRETLFLDAVRAHKNMALHSVTHDNRDSLYYELISKIELWNSY